MTDPTTEQTADHSKADAVRAARNAALWAFIGTLSTTTLGWLADVAHWASSSGATQFPGLSVLGYGVVSAAVAAGTFVLAAAVRLAQAAGWVPGKPPTYKA